MRSYIALIHKDPDSDYGVSFPDFPGCISAGSTIDEAKDMAHEALALHVEGMVEEDQALPEPSTLEAVMADDNNRDAVAFLVSLPEKPIPTVRVNITMSADDLGAIDAFAEAHGFTRSGFLVQAAKKAMKRRVA